MMDPAREPRAEEIFTKAIELQDSDRRAFLEQNCGDDRELLARVEALLRTYTEGQAALGSGFGKRVRALLEEAVDEPTPDLESPVSKGQTLSHYRLVEKIGEGGMGMVWRAEDTVLKRTVAIKVLPADLALEEKRRQMFLNEARLAASLSHGNIVQVHELGSERDLDFIVMEHVEGQPLSRILAGKPLRAEKVVRLGGQVAQGLARAHQKRLIHRDLKPANILITPSEEVKVVDFGLATLFSAAGTATQSWMDGFSEMLDRKSRTAMVGTLPYMSPEQVRREALDSRSDVFSLGTVLYEMATGQRPFIGSTPAELALQIQKGISRPPHALVPMLPLELNRIIEKALSPSPADRYQTMDDMAVDLRRLSREIDSGSPLSLQTVHQVAKERRMGSWSLATAGLILVAAVVLVLGSRSERTTGAATPEREKPALVVLPFENHGPPEDAYLAAGLTDEIADRLSRVPEMSVVSSAVSTRYDRTGKTTRRIAQELGVDYVVQGSMRWDRRSDSIETFSAELNLAVGDHVDFSVGDGGNGYNSDSSGISARIVGPRTQAENAGGLYDAFADFEIESYGAWSYGYTDSLGGTFTLMSVSFDMGDTWDPEYGCCAIGLATALGPDPNISRNKTGTDVINNGVLLDGRDFLHIHPGPNGEHAVVRFTAPATGSYQLTTAFKNLRVSGPAATTDVHVLANGVSVFDGRIDVASNNRVWVKTEIVRARDGALLWAHDYECRSAEVIDVGSNVAAAVVDQLGITPPAHVQAGLNSISTTNMFAHQAYLRGRHLLTGLATLNPEAWRMGIQLYERALEHDSRLLLAHVGLAQAHAAFCDWKWDCSEARLQKAESAVLQARALDPNSPHSRLASGYYYRGSKQLDRALEAFESVRDSWPDSAEVLAGIADIMSRRGEFTAALEHLENAVRSDPRNATLLYRLAEMYSVLHRYREAERVFDRAIAIAPDAPSAYMNKANNALLQGSLSAAWTICDKSPPAVTGEYAAIPFLVEYHLGRFATALHRARELPELVQNRFGVVSKSLCMAMAYDAMNQTDSAAASWVDLRDTIEERLKDHPEDGDLRGALGLAYAGIGNREEAIRQGGLALELTGDDTWVRPSRVFDLAQIHSLVGDPDTAVDQLESLFQVPNNVVSVSLARRSPMFERLADHPKFQSLMSRRY